MGETNLTESCTILETVYLDIEEIIAGKLDGLLNRSITENILPSETFTEKLIALTTTENLKLIMPTVPISVVIKMKINGSYFNHLHQLLLLLNPLFLQLLQPNQLLLLINPIFHLYMYPLLTLTLVKENQMLKFLQINGLI